ncbi:DUF4179 domain-containing protein [Paenibacillus chartarius]|uniref:DUF4179 domain-containing protein n=1 Tax=Paenibacillus chartarius TaxID=747481 RepID=A0ABV6DSJ8_9BACL
MFDQQELTPFQENVTLPPPEQLELHIRHGIAQAKQMTEQRRRRRKLTWLSGAAAVCLVLLLAITVRVSPAFASALGEVPGLQLFVKLVQGTSDQGIKLAVGNDFVQSVGVTDEKADASFTVEGIVADESRVVVFYAMRAKDSGKRVRLDRPEVRDASGNRLPTSISWGDPRELELNGTKKSDGLQRGLIDIQVASGGSLPDQIVYHADYRLENVAAEPKMVRAGDTDPFLSAPPGRTEAAGTASFEVTIPIDKARFASMKRTYDLDHWVEADGQRIHFTKATVNPLRIAVEMEYDSANTMQIFDSVDMRLTDERGTVWRSIGGSSSGANRDIVYFESTYFHTGKELYLEGKRFRALDKERAEVVVNTDTAELLRAPDEKLSLEEVSQTDRYTRISFKLKGIEEGDNMGYTVLEGQFKDASGNLHQTGNFGGVVSSWTAGNQDEQTHFVYLNNETYPQPLTFPVYNYPSYLEVPFRIRIE